MGNILKKVIVGLFAFIAIFGVGCGSSGVRNTVSGLMNTEITFPETLQGKVKGRDTTASGLLAAPYKLVVYMNSTQCDGCRLKDLLVWKNYMARIDSLEVADSLRFVFVFHPKNAAVWAQQLKLYDFSIPVWLDAEGDFERMNRLPDDPAFHTFLLDSGNRILLIGSPIGRPKMWKLYEQTAAKMATGRMLPSEVRP